MNLHSEKTIRFARNALNSHIMAEAVKSGTKKTAATLVIAKRIGVDRKSLKDFVEGDVAKPSKRVMQKYADWLGKNPETTIDPRDEKPQLELVTPKPAAKKAEPLSDNDIALILDIVHNTQLDLETDRSAMEYPSDGLEYSLASIRAVHQKEKRLDQVCKKLESLASCEFDFDDELQCLVIKA